jgi:ABC-type branched-subunit amino acid transport system substrate-binding protein
VAPRPSAIDFATEFAAGSVAMTNNRTSPPLPKETRMSPLPASARPRRWLPDTLTGLLTVVLLLATACSTKTTTETARKDGTLATGPGVSGTVIKLGVLTDQTGPFAPASKDLQTGRTLYWDKKNAQGGVCNRRVEFVTRDHGYNVQKAIGAYAQVEPNVLAFDELLGSPELAALGHKIRSDQMLTMAVSWSSQLLDNPYMVVTGATYDVEAINGISWLMQNRGLAKGATIGHIFLEGDFGENAVAGSRVAARKYGLRLVEQKIKPTDADLTGQITALRAAGARFILLTTTPAQTASAVGVAGAGGFDATFLATGPAYHPALLKTQVKDALVRNLLVTTPVAPFSSSAAAASEVRQAYQAKYPSQPASVFVTYGYAQGQVMAQILESACTKGALTRSGLLAAFQGLTNVDTGGLVAPMDYSRQGQIPTRQVYVGRPDPAAPGGLTQVQGLFSALLATNYDPSH